jgi:hypothetical protein
MSNNTARDAWTRVACGPGKGVAGWRQASGLTKPKHKPCGKNNILGRYGRCWELCAGVYCYFPSTVKAVFAP